MSFFVGGESLRHIGAALLEPYRTSPWCSGESWLRPWVRAQRQTGRNAKKIFKERKYKTLELYLYYYLYIYISFIAIYLFLLALRWKGGVQERKQLIACIVCRFCPRYFHVGFRYCTPFRLCCCRCTLASGLSSDITDGQTFCAFRNVIFFEYFTLWYWLCH